MVALFHRLDPETLVVQVVVVQIVPARDQTQVELAVGQQERAHLNQLKDILAVMKMHQLELVAVDMNLLAVVVPGVLVKTLPEETLEEVDMVV